MRFSCPACQTPFEVHDASLAPREAVELDCPGCHRALLLEPTPTGAWGILPVAPPPAEPMQPQVQLPSRPRPQSSGFYRDLGQVKFELPDPAARKAPPPQNNLWQEMSVLFRLDQVQKSRKSLYAWGAVVVLLLGGIAALLSVKLSADRALDDLKAMRAGLSAFTLPYQTSDADKTAPGTVLSRKLVMSQKLSHPAQVPSTAEPLPEPVTPEVAALPPPHDATPAMGGGLDVKARLDHACQQHAAEISACARKYMVPRPLRVRFIVNVKGRPESVRVSGGGDQHDAFQGCVARGLHDLDVGVQVLELRYTCAVP
jgi:predicted Zn finger-like uncharacterized protein